MVNLFRRLWCATIGWRRITKPNYRPLPIADGPSDGSALTVRIPGYTHNPLFNTGMGQAIDQATTRLTKALMDQAITPELIAEILQEIGQARRKIELEAGNAFYRRYGYPLPFDLATFRKYLEDCSLCLRPGESELDLMQFNKITDRITRKNRHRTFFDRAHKYALDFRNEGEDFWGNKISVVIPVNGVPTTFQLTKVQLEPYIESLAVVHPTFLNSLLLARRGYELLAEALTLPNVVEEEVVRRMAEAHFLFMHGTPFLNGTPSCILALNDAILRAQLGRCLPALRPGIEPFWEAILGGQNGMKQFIGHYRDFFE
jgi:hypothetical protein